MKKNLMNRLVILLLLLAAVPVSVHAAVIPPEWEGDVNLDGEVDISDATYLINGLLNEVIVPSMDVNQDGVINITDATCLINMLLNMPSATETYVVNGVSFKMIYVRAGSYEMGATDEQTGATQDEYPPHLVQLTPYYIGETEVSQELWYAVMGDNPSYSKGYNLPVEQITWYECQEFVNRLSQITGRQFRLPTEAEWEFAARGAHKSGGFLYSGSNILSQVGWYDTNSGGKTNLIKQLMGNERQLYDMSGNVWEWCQDWFGDYSDDHQLDPKGPAEGLERVVRGGGWEAPDAFCRVAYRKGQAPGQPDEHIGLRLAMDVYDTYWLTLSSRVVSMEVGESRSVNILNGSGDYTIYNNNAEIVNCTLSGDTLNISGLSVGTTTITVLDNLTHCQVDVTAIVYEHVEPSTFVVNGVEFSVNFVQGGNYVMGGTSEQGSDAQGFERPAHYVTLSDYYMGATEVTQALWHAVMGNNPSYFAGVDYLNYPVEQVTWDECQEFVCRLSEITGRTFRMPTEAEWEFAARGGLKSHGYKYAGGDLLDLVAWHSDNAFTVGASDPNYGTHAVATKDPNELGLYDMSGNVMEWCLDLSAAYTTETQVNPTGPYSGSSVVGRGGGWQSAAANCRVSSRYTLSPTNKHFTRGLRVVMEPYRPATSHFDVFERVIRVQVGTTRLVDILNGSGDYLINCNRISDYATCSIVGDQIEVTGVSAGTGIVAVKDRQTGAVTWFTVIVKGPLALSKNELSLYVNQTDTVNIINGNGRYSVECDTSIVTASLDGDHLIVHGVAPGNTTVSVTDLSIGGTVSLEVTVVEPYSSDVEVFVVNGVTFRMITVEGGTFMMGASAGDTEAYSQEKPAHQVSVSTYKIGETEVTQELWQAVMGNNPSYFTGNLQRPVEQITWNDCFLFIHELNRLTGRNFRLLSEAEWEFAARGGNKSEGYKYSGSDNIDDVAWYTVNAYDVGNSSPEYGSHAVATKAPNELGIYDMSGNVNEWCQDLIGNNYTLPYYSSSLALINPKGMSYGYNNRSKRLGSWNTQASRCCNSARTWENPKTFKSNNKGFRLALDVKNESIDFMLSESVVMVEQAASKSINILNGSGSYSFAGGTDYVITSVSGNTLTVKGMEEGTTNVHVTDQATGEIFVLVVIVTKTNDFKLLHDELTIEVGEQKPIQIYNGHEAYQVSSSSPIVNTVTRDYRLMITGIEVGTTTVTITDVSSGSQDQITVHVIESTNPVVSEEFVVKGIRFTMVSVEGGTFMMGTTNDDDEGGADTKPIHQVTLSSFKIAQTEVTQELWVAVMGSNPSYHTGNLQRPVEQVTWSQCQTFISKLKTLTGKTFRLPTEAEWEYAARGGNRSKGYRYAGSNNRRDVAWYSGNSWDVTQAVATKSPNELGLYDMSGNVSEWCKDWYNATYYSISPQTNPKGPSTGTYYVCRGGGDYCPIVFRRMYGNGFGEFNGLRLAL